MVRAGHIPKPTLRLSLVLYLNISGTPIVHEDHSEEMVFCVCNGNWFAHFIWLSHERGNFQLDIEFLTWSPFRDFLLRFHIGNLAVWSSVKSPKVVPLDVHAGDNYGGRTTMVSYWYMIIIRLQCVLRTSVHCSHAKRMVSARVKVRVITDEHG
jgi:hypothetical protein